MTKANHVALAGLLLLAIGCQPAPKRETRRFGRSAYGNVSRAPMSPMTQSTFVTNSAGDMIMSYEAGQLAAPALGDQPQWALGFVSASSGVRLWGEAYVIRTDAASGSIDSQRSRLHIEVTDNRVGTTDAEGNVLPPFVLHIGSDQSGFEGAVGGINNGGVDLRFNQSGYGYVAVRGTLSGNTFAGQVYFSNVRTGGERYLGQFSVNACSFFVCQ